MPGNRGDVRSYEVPATSSVPALPTQWTEAQITNLASGASSTFIVTTTPVSSLLGIWNFLLSIYVDVPGQGGGGGPNLTADLGYIFPDGVGLTAAQRALTLMQWVDWAESSDNINTRVHKIRLTNNDSAPHTYLLRYKAYTNSSVAGV